MADEKLWTIEEADAALEADLQRLEERLRSERPDLFDEAGAFREDKAQRELEQRVSQKNVAVQRQIAALTRRSGRRSSDAT